MKAAIGIGIGVAVLIIAIASVYVYSTTESPLQPTSEFPENEEPITFSESVESNVTTKEQKTIKIQVTDDLGVGDKP